MPASIAPTLSASGVGVWLCACSCGSNSKINEQSPEMYLVPILARRIIRDRCFRKVEEMKNARFLCGHHIGLGQASPDRVCSQTEVRSQNRPEKRGNSKIL